MSVLEVCEDLCFFWKQSLFFLLVLKNLLSFTLGENNQREQSCSCFGDLSVCSPLQVCQLKCRKYASVYFLQKPVPIPIHISTTKAYCIIFDTLISKVSKWPEWSKLQNCLCTVVHNPLFAICCLIGSNWLVYQGLLVWF